jgi:hypothetical protein
MKKIAAAILVMTMGVVLTLGAVLALLVTAIWIAAIANPFVRIGALFAELFIGVGLLLGTIYVATQMAVRYFRPSGPVPSNDTPRT